MINHMHCSECGKMLPPNQPICVKCMDKMLEEETKPRKPYYECVMEENNE